ncbi:MAG: hypothetical protein LBV33_06550 [Lachnospiraceae bacterium]|nr:hypothetical protein [Lachnospiraceae bacterium]
MKAKRKWALTVLLCMLLVVNGSTTYAGQATESSISQTVNAISLRSVSGNDDQNTDDPGSGELSSPEATASPDSSPSPVPDTSAEPEETTGPQGMPSPGLIESPEDEAMSEDGEGLEADGGIGLLAASLGDGSKENPFMITDAQSFKNIKNNLSAHYELATNIDFNKEKLIPIGTESMPFTGVLNGNNYTLKNFSINGDGYHAGLFGYMRGATVTDLLVEGGQLTRRTSALYTGILAGYLNNCTVNGVRLMGNTITAGNYSGTLAGYVSGGTITGCSAEIKAGAGSVTGNNDTGGLIGKTLLATVIRCFSDVAVQGAMYTGGLVGSVEGVQINPGKVEESYSTGKVSSGSIYVAGLVGYIMYGEVNNCFAIASVSSTSTIKATWAGLVGRMIASGVTNSYAVGAIKAGGSGLANAGASNTVTDSYFDIIASGITDIDVDNVGKLSTGMLREAGFPAWDFEKVWAINEGSSYPYLQNIKEPVFKAVNTSGQPLGSGTSDDPYLISTVNQYKMIRLEMTGHFRLSADIDFKKESLTPIGTDLKPFSGGLDGDDHTLRNFVISTTTSYAGLFGYMKDATVKDLIIEGAEIRQGNLLYTGALSGYLNNCTVENIILKDINLSGGSFNGSLSGYADQGSISGCSVIGKLSIVGSSERNGGLVGRTVGTRVSDCLVSAEGSVTGARFTGGLIGEMSSGTIEKCAAVINVKAPSFVGGLIGYAVGSATTPVKVEQCFAMGNVTDGINIGGLLGSIEYGGINNCYAVGQVKPSSDSVYAGGLVGKNSNTPINNSFAAVSLNQYGNGLAFLVGTSPVTNSYFDATIARKTAPVNQAKTTAQLSDPATFVNWDMAGIWDHQNGTYPTLKKVTVASSLMPFALTISSVTTDSAVIDWSDIKEATGYELSYDDKSIIFETSEATLENLLPDTEYLLKARALFEGKTGMWSGEVAVRTKPIPQSPGGLHATQKTSDSITMAWNQLADIASYDLVINNRIINTSENSATLTGLTPGVHYLIYLKAHYNDGSTKISETVMEKIYTLAPQTDYARTFIDKCEGQTWFIDEMEKLLNLKGKSVNTIASRDDLSTIYAIGLADRGLTGTIPAAIGELSNLKYLYLANNRLEGELPDEYYSLTNLIETDLSGNNLIE